MLYFNNIFEIKLTFESFSALRLSQWIHDKKIQKPHWVYLTPSPLGFNFLKFLALLYATNAVAFHHWQPILSLFASNSKNMLVKCLSGWRCKHLGTFSMKNCNTKYYEFWTKFNDWLNSMQYSKFIISLQFDNQETYYCDKVSSRVPNKWEDLLSMIGKLLTVLPPDLIWAPPVSINFLNLKIWKKSPESYFHPLPHLFGK